MPKTIAELIQGREIVAVPSTTPVGQALKLMYDNKFSQLPVTGRDQRLMGIFTEQELMGTLLFGQIEENLSAPVGNWTMRAQTIKPKRNIYDVMALLEHASAVVVVDHADHPIGIVTDYDIAAFLAEWSKGFSIIEDIELRLRGYTDRVLPTQNARRAALYHAFNKVREKQGRPLIEYSKLTLGGQIQLITCDENWMKFDPYFAPRATFMQLMEAANSLRNQVAHFRGQLTLAQLNTLAMASNWLERCPRVPAPDNLVATTNISVIGNSQQEV